MQLIIGVLILFFAINFAVIANGVAIIAIMATGPVLLGLYMYFLHKSNSTTYTLRVGGKNLLIGSAVGVAMFVSTGSMILFVMQNPEMIF
jgi:hypothetical protein